MHFNSKLTTLHTDIQKLSHSMVNVCVDELIVTYPNLMNLNFAVVGRLITSPIFGRIFIGFLLLLSMLLNLDEINLTTRDKRFLTRPVRRKTYFQFMSVVSVCGQFVNKIDL